MTSPSRERKQFNWGALGVILAILFGIGFTVYVFSPGFMSPDSFSQLIQARQNSYTDLRPPVMSWVWGQFDRILPGPLGMLIFQNLLFWCGLGLWVRLTTPHWNPFVQSLVILLVGLFPPVFAILGTLWKDVWMAGAFLLATALLLYAHERKSRVAFFSGIFFIGYGMAARHNGIIGALPLLIYAGWVFNNLLIKQPSNITRLSIVRAASLGLGLLACLWLSVNWVNTRLTHGKSTYPVQQILVHDLTAISVTTHDVVLPDFVWSGTSPLSIHGLERIYSTQKGVISLYNPGDESVGLKFIQDSRQISALEQTWLRAVIHHPKAYLWHRLQVFSSEFAITGKKVCYPYQVGITRNDLGLSFDEKPLTTKILMVLDKLKNSLFFRGWMYIVLSPVIMIGLFILRKQICALAIAGLIISGSGLLYALGYFWISTTCDFRLHYWTVITTIVSVVPFTSLILQKVSF